MTNNVNYCNAKAILLTVVIKTIVLHESKLKTNIKLIIFKNIIRNQVKIQLFTFDKNTLNITKKNLL